MDRGELTTQYLLDGVECRIKHVSAVTAMPSIIMPVVEFAVPQSVSASPKQ
jgi:hypothetical protein